MKKKYRLLKSFEFQNLLKSGNKISSSNLICYWKPNNSIDNVKIGIIIPKKRCKLSCKRKKYKRVFWAINGLDLSTFPKVKCVFFYRDVFFSKYDNKEISFLNIKKEYYDLIGDLRRRVGQ